MEIQTQYRGAVLVVRPAGPLAGADADTFKTAVQGFVRENLGRVVLDASALSYVDSKGLESLADIAEEMALSGKGLKLCAANDTLRQVIELTGLAPQFEHFEDTHTAVRSFL
ncbi:MAG: STAS domain-containing protein [Planctomycetes bacterium]|nr:STAS domain-containing protein [Planctomycetota bacterium]